MCAQEAADGGRLSSELVEEMEAAERKDRYIDQILRKRQGRPLGMAARGRKPAGVVWPPAAASQHPVQPGVQVWMAARRHACYANYAGKCRD